MTLFRPIHHTFGPHVDVAYLQRTTALSYAPWSYRKGMQHIHLASDLRERFGYDASLFASGREALLALLRAFDLPAGSEVIVQAFTCVVVPNAVKAAGLKTVFADIDQETLNMTPATVSKAATPLTRVVICQHTFGIPSPAHELKTLCDRQGWIFIEDCAHVLPDAMGPVGILQHADHAICSFGRDKAVSGIGGGAALTKNAETAARLKEQERTAKELPWIEIVRLLEYPSRMALVVRPLTGLRLAAPIVTLLRVLGLFAPVVTEDEKQGRMMLRVRRMPNVCASLARWHLSQLERINDHRRTLTRRYMEASHVRGWRVLRGLQPTLPLQKYPMIVDGAAHIRTTLRSRNIHLDDGWTDCIVCPASCSAVARGHQPGSTPHAETVAQSLLSVPTHPTMTLFQTNELFSALDPLLRS